MLFTYNEHDDVVLHQLKEFNKKPLTSAENYLTNAGASTSKENETVQGKCGFMWFSGCGKYYFDSVNSLFFKFVKRVFHRFFHSKQKRMNSVSKIR